MWCSSWTSLHYKYMAATWIEPAFSIIHLAAWLSHPKQDIIAVHALLLPACQPVKVPLVGLIKLDLIWNDQCGLSRPRVVIFISLKYFIFSYTPLFVGLLLSCRQYSWRCEDLSDPKTFSCSTRCLKNATSSRCASQQPIVLAQKKQYAENIGVMGVILPQAHGLHRLPAENMTHKQRSISVPRKEDWNNWNERNIAEPLYFWCFTT